MKFGVPDLKTLSKAVRESDPLEDIPLSYLLHHRQPAFWWILDEIAMDPRCMEAHRFCTRFCALAFIYAEQAAGYSLPSYPEHIIRNMAGFMVRGEEAQIGKRACGFPKRIFRHVLRNSEFDEEDTEWLCTTISAFLFVVERSVRA